MQTLHLTQSQIIDFFVSDPMYQYTDAETAGGHPNLVYAQKLGYGGILDGGNNDKANYSGTLGSVSGGQSSRQSTLTQAASKLYSQVKKIEAHDSSRSSPKLLSRTNDMKRLLDIFNPGVNPFAAVLLDIPE
jgi:hypothetical protein